MTPQLWVIVALLLVIIGLLFLVSFLLDKLDEKNRDQKRLHRVQGVRLE